MVTITRASANDRAEIIETWEKSVLASHHFLNPSAVAYYKTQMPRYLDAVTVYLVSNRNGNVDAFIGLAEDKIEMLFVHPALFGTGLGKRLLHFALTTCGARYVDVNEENVRAVDFYLSNGFAVMKRSELDSAGKPHPILHLQLGDAG